MKLIYCQHCSQPLLEHYRLCPRCGVVNRKNHDSKVISLCAWALFGFSILYALITLRVI